MTLYKRLSAWISRRKYLVLSFLVLLISLTLTAHATLTVSNTGLQGDTNITLDANGTLGIGTASATAITIGQSSLNVSIPGSLTVSSATTTVNNLHVTGSCLGCGVLNGITAINGLSNATTSLVAGSNITIATSSPNIITISASGGSGSTTPGGSNTQLQFNSSGGFGASGNLTWLSPALTIGQTGTTTGQLKLAGSTSGTVTVQASSTSGTWNLTLPTSAGTAGYVLSTDGSGNTSWIAQSGGSTVSIDGLTNSAFNFTASGTGLSIATTSPNTVAYTFTNPGFVTSAITAINGLSNATTSLVAGSNITIATSSPNVITISASGGSGSTTPGGSNTQLQFNSSGAFGASGNLTWLSPALTIGQTGTTTGQLKLAGSTSGTVTVQASSTAGTWNMTLPTSAGTSGYVLSTDGSGNTSWIAQSGGTGITAINGLSNSTTTIAAGSGVTIATSSPNVITITATGGSASTTDLQTVGMPQMGGVAIGTVGTTGSTVYAYCAVATDVNGNTRSQCFNTAVGNATLSGSNYNTITVSWNSLVSPNIPATGSCSVYRTVGGATQGKIGTIPSCASGGTLNDTGLAGDGTSVPADTSGAILLPGGLTVFGSAGPTLYQGNANLTFTNLNLSSSPTNGYQPWYTHSVIFGNGTYANSGITALGFAQNVTAHACTAIGYGTACTGGSGLALGIGASSDGGIAIGNNSLETGSLLAIGGTATGGNGSIAIGGTSAYTYSVVIGQSAAATAFYQFILGASTIHNVLAGYDGTNANATYWGGGYSTTITYSAAGTPLPTCNSANKLMRVAVSDATVATPGTTYTSGGTYTIWVECIFNSSGTTYSWIVD